MDFLNAFGGSGVMQPNQGAKLLDEDDFLNSFGEK
jgi:hypothetical protein